MDITNELNRRIKNGVRNIHVSPLFEKGKIYNLKTELEDKDGTLAPAFSHCWLSWESKWFDEAGTHWSNEAYSFSNKKEAEKAKLYLEKHTVK